MHTVLVAERIYKLFELMIMYEPEPENRCHGCKRIMAKGLHWCRECRKKIFCQQKKRFGLDEYPCIFRTYHKDRCRFMLFDGTISE